MPTGYDVTDRFTPEHVRRMVLGVIPKGVDPTGLTDGDISIELSVQNQRVFARVNGGELVEPPRRVFSGEVLPGEADSAGNVTEAQAPSGEQRTVSDVPNLSANPVPDDVGKLTPSGFRTSAEQQAGVAPLAVDQVGTPATEGRDEGPAAGIEAVAPQEDRDAGSDNAELERMDGESDEDFEARKQAQAADAGSPAIDLSDINFDDDEDKVQ